MGKQRHKKEQQKEKKSPSNTLFTEEDTTLIEKMKDLLLIFQEKYGLSTDQLSQMLTEELFFPNSILVKDLTPLHSVVKYLKENKRLSLAKIAPLIGRDQRNVWRMYSDAKKRHPDALDVSGSTFFIPVSIFLNNSLSAQEALVCHFKDSLDLSYHEIAVLLSRDDRTIWTVYNRAKKKHAKK